MQVPFLNHILPWQPYCKFGQRLCRPSGAQRADSKSGSRLHRRRHQYHTAWTLVVVCSAVPCRATRVGLEGMGKLGKQGRGKAAEYPFEPKARCRKTIRLAIASQLRQAITSLRARRRRQAMQSLSEYIAAFTLGVIDDDKRHKSLSDYIATITLDYIVDGRTTASDSIAKRLHR